jgi:hypothetical protein
MNIESFVLKKYFSNIVLMEQTNETIIKKERRAAWRWGEDGKYNHKPNSEILLFKITTVKSSAIKKNVHYVVD